MTRYLTPQENALLYLLAASSESRSREELSTELRLRDFRITGSQMTTAAARLVSAGLAVKGTRQGSAGRSVVTYACTPRGRGLAGLPAGTAAVTSSAPRPAPDYLTPVLPGQVWEGKKGGSVHGRRVQVERVEDGGRYGDTVRYRILEPAHGRSRRQDYGHCSPGTLRTAYRLVSRGSPDSPGDLVVHLMVLPEDDPEGSDTFTRCCGFSWRSVARTGLVTLSRELVTCPGRP